MPANVPNRPTVTGRQAAGGGAALLIGTALALMLGEVLDRGEGNRLVAYDDGGGVWTACRGVIRNIDGSPIRRRQRFTEEQCAILNDGETVRHLRYALDAVPRLREGCPENCRHGGQILSGASLAFNIGGPGFARSTVARRWNAGDWYGGCVAFALWNRDNGRVIRGLALRRAWEQSDLCFVGIPIPAGVRVPAPTANGRAWERQLRAMGAGR